MEGGFLIPTYVKESTIKGAGKGRFIIGNHKKGSIIRKQEINSETLHVIKNKDELENYNIEYWIMDIINPDYGKIINKIKGKRVFFDLSNIFSYHTSHVCYTLTELVESLDRLIETLSNNTEYFFIRGKKPTKQSMPNEKN